MNSEMRYGRPRSRATVLTEASLHASTELRSADLTTASRESLGSRDIKVLSRHEDPCCTELYPRLLSTQPHIVLLDT